MGKKNDQKSDGSSSNVQNGNSVDPKSLDRLTEGVNKMGIVLGAAPVDHKPQNSSQAVSNSDGPAASEDFQRPDMTAEEKKQQRAAKAAEKKARAEAAAAKKAAGGPQQPQPAQVKGNAKKENKPSEPKKEKEPTPPKAETAEGTTKSALRHAKADSKPDTKEVQFDLSANTVKSLSGSEENLAAGAQNAAQACPVEDAASVAHIDPAFLTLAARCEADEIGDLDQLCQEFISAFRKYLKSWSDERAREGADVSSTAHDLDLAIRPQLAHLTHEGRWPLPLALGNIVRQMKKEILKIVPTEAEIKNEKFNPTSELDQWLQDCQTTNFHLAYDFICDHLKKKLLSSPSVMTYDWCPIVNTVLLKASAENDCKRQYTVVDSEMNGRGIRHVKSFIDNGIRCRYTDLKSSGSAMQSCSMLLIGCSAVLSNGCVAAPKGAMQLALTAKAFNVPMLVVAQSFKFVDKVQSYGRMSLLGREQIELVPADLVTAIVTDMRILPPSSAPAVLKAKALEMQ